jgi:hypothetical protein
MLGLTSFEGETYASPLYLREGIPHLPYFFFSSQTVVID